jgi:hypothetical protein
LSRSSISLLFCSKKFMRKKISVIPGKGVEIGDPLARYARVADDVGGADVVILSGEADFHEIRDRAPNAVLLIAGDGQEERCKAAYEATLFPRARIIGVGDAAAAAASIVFESDEEHDVVAMRDGAFSSARARLGRGGIRRLL